MEEEEYEDSRVEQSSKTSKSINDKEIEIKTSDIPISSNSSFVSANESSRNLILSGSLSSYEQSVKGSSKKSKDHKKTEILSTDKDSQSKKNKNSENSNKSKILSTSDIQSSYKTSDSSKSYSKPLVKPKDYISRSMRFDYKIGDHINKYKIEKLICRGGFCDIYLVHQIDDKKKYSLKIEPTKVHHPTLPHENFVLNELESSPFYLKKIEYVETKHKAILVTELLGANLHDIAMSLPEKRLPISTALRIAIEMLRCLEDFHSRGFIHRDIKPSNFVVRPDRSHPVALIDLGLSRYYKDKNGDRYPPRPDARFVGTVTYASPSVLRGEDAAVKDDLVSWYYSILELIFGSLPWSGSDSKETVAQEMESTDFEAFSNYIPRQIYSIHKIIKQYNRYDKPDYALITSFLVQAMWENGIKWCHPYCWEEVSDDKFKDISPISMISFWTKEPIEPKDLPEAKVPGENSTETQKNPVKEKRKAGCLWI